MKPKISISLSGSSTLFTVFLVLKLVGVINWSWWWITAPLWIPFSIGLLLVFLIILAKVLVEIF
jgi:hypothetical protein